MNVCCSSMHGESARATVQDSCTEIYPLPTYPTSTQNARRYGEAGIRLGRAACKALLFKQKKHQKGSAARLGPPGEGLCLERCKLQPLYIRNAINAESVIIQ